MKPPKIAIVHDSLTSMGGAERVLLALHEAFPEAPIYTSAYEPDKLPLFKELDIRTTWLQKLPRPFRQMHRLFPAMRVNAFRDLDLSEFDVIISSSRAEAKQVRKTRKNQVHICYCHTPIRYYWSHYDEYKRDPGFGRLNWLARLLIPLTIPTVRRADYEAAQKVDVFVANSTEVQKRIKEHYHRTSTIVYPPVDMERFKAASMPANERSGYIIVGRQVPYKRVDLAIAACNKLKLPLTVIGDGPEYQRLVAMAGNSIKFDTDPERDDEKIARLLGASKGFIFPAEEDFAIVQIEALSAGTPVIAYGRGGTLDVIKDNESGIVFSEQTVASLVSALKQAEAVKFEPEAARRTAKRFSKTLFISKIKNVTGDAIS